MGVLAEAKPLCTTSTTSTTSELYALYIEVGCCHSSIHIGIDKQWPEGMLLQVALKHCTHLWFAITEHSLMQSVTADVLSVSM